MQAFVNVIPFQLGYCAPFPKISQTLLAAEPSLTNASVEAVAISGGMLSKIALKHIQAAFIKDIYNAKQAGLSAVVSVKVQRLVVGAYPDVPGWHCDGVPRCHHHGQPNFRTVNPASFHVAVTLSSEPNGVSNTEFVMDAIKPKIFDQENVYKDLHQQVERIKPRVEQAPDGMFVKYLPKTVHRAREAHRRGWRMHLKFSMVDRPIIENMVGEQQQVYVVSTNNGW